MTQGRSELPRVYFPSKLEEGTRVTTEVVYVKHGLRVRQIREVYCQSGINPISAPEVRYAT